MVAKGNYFAIAILLSIVTGQIFGQDTTIYRQANASLFSNNYTLIKANSSDKFGTFYQNCWTDDMQHWYGQGVFKETLFKISLTFDTIKNHNRIETINSIGHNDTLYIKWFDTRGQPQEWFNIRFADTIKYKNIYNVIFYPGFVKIPKSELYDRNLSLYPYNSNRKIIEFEAPMPANEIRIYANDTNRIHYFDKRKESLRKTNNGFVTVGMWTNNKKIKFVMKQN